MTSYSMSMDKIDFKSIITIMIIKRLMMQVHISVS